MIAYGIHIVMETGCPSGKRGYHTRKDAKKFIKAQHNDIKDLHPYDCQHCAYWHLGHKIPARFRQ